MRVALLGPAPPDRGGIAHETSRLAEELSRLASVSYLTFSRPYPRWLDPRRYGRDPRLASSPANGVLDYLSPRTWRTTADHIVDLSADALIVPWWTSFWSVPMRAVFRRLASVAPRTRRVLLCHNLEDHEAGLFQRFLTVGVLSVADAFVVHNEENRREIERRFSARPTTAIPLPVPVSTIDPDAARRKLGVEGRLILFLGLIRSYKGVDVLIDAAPRIVRETGSRIAIVGEAFANSESVRRLWQSSVVRDRILFKDQYVSEEEMALWLAACDALALPYRKISSSAIAARGIGACRPVVASAVGGLKEVILPGQTGELFAAGDSNGLADAIARVFERGKEAYRPALERMAREMAWPRYAERILEFIREIGRRW